MIFLVEFASFQCFYSRYNVVIFSDLFQIEVFNYGLRQTLIVEIQLVPIFLDRNPC